MRSNIKMWLLALVQSVTCSWEMISLNTVKVPKSQVTEIASAEPVKDELECIWHAEHQDQCHGFDMDLLNNQRMCRLTAVNKEVMGSKFTPFSAISGQMSNDDEHHSISKYWKKRADTFTSNLLFSVRDCGDIVCFIYKVDQGKLTAGRCCHYPHLGSQNRGAYYLTNSHIEYHVYTKPNCKIELRFSQIKTVCPDYVKIFDDSGLIANYCGKYGPQTIVSTGPYIHLKFVSDGSREHAGFKGWFKKGIYTMWQLQKWNSWFNLANL